MSEVDVVIESGVAPSSTPGDFYAVKNVAVEEDLKDLLPSVKNLANVFTSDTRGHNISASEKINIVDDGVEVIRKPALESYVPSYNYSYHPAEPNPNVTIQNGTVATTNGAGDVIRARSKSPILTASNLRGSIAFFENLKK